MGVEAEYPSRQIAVIDIGSNSVRLVLYRLEGRAVWTMFNEKVLAGLGRDLAATRRLSVPGVALAMTALRRFAAVIEGVQPDQTIIAATAAVREADDGADFCARVAAETGLQVRVLSGEDEACAAYVERFGSEAALAAEKQRAAAVSSAPTAKAAATVTNLDDAIIRGLKADAARLAKEALATENELSLVEKHLIPALDKVGTDYERGVAFLPQLLGAAQAAQAVFSVIRDSLAAKGGEPVKKGRIVIATVKGDIHDIGKNIVRTVLENYGYDVLDLGRDVPPETVVDAVVKENIRLVGLSALMTTTLPSMEETVRQLHTLPNPPSIMVGGAVVTPEYAQKMGAFYAKDARASVEIAKKVLG